MTNGPERGLITNQNSDLFTTKSQMSLNASFLSPINEPIEVFENSFAEDKKREEKRPEILITNPPSSVWVVLKYLGVARCGNSYASANPRF